jgi:hypothetical protein
MMIARMLVRGGLLTLAVTAAMATANTICRIMRSPSPSDSEAQGTRSEQVSGRSASNRRPRSARSRRA